MILSEAKNLFVFEEKLLICILIFLISTVKLLLISDIYALSFAVKEVLTSDKHVINSLAILMLYSM